MGLSGIDKSARATGSTPGTGYTIAYLPAHKVRKS